jgi:hypothetical protein
MSTDAVDWHVQVYACKGKSKSSVALVEMPVVDWPIPPKFTVTIDSATKAIIDEDTTPNYVG